MVENACKLSRGDTRMLATKLHSPPALKAVSGPAAPERREFVQKAMRALDGLHG